MRWAVVAALVMSGVGVALANASSAAPEVVAAPSDATLTCARSVVATWSVETLSHEVVVVTTASTSTAIMREAAREGFGGVLLLGTAVPSDLVTTLHSLSPSHRPVSVLTDDEGGGVVRVPSLSGRWPWAQVIGATMSTTAITALATGVGRRLVAAGITIDLAPVADVDGRAQYPGPANPDGFRSFSGQSAIAGADATAFALGLQAGGEGATLKHFPGLGGSTGNTDSGRAFTKPWSVLQRGDLLPFRVGVRAGVASVMMSNAIVPGLTTVPASLSASAVNALRALGFRGLIVTDALGAGAISVAGFTPAMAAVRAIAVGDDQLLGGQPSSPQQGLRTAQSMVAALVAAVTQHHLPLSRLRDAAAHVVVSQNVRCPHG
jgi:beta-N-acetylhexosaminidase